MVQRHLLKTEEKENDFIRVCSQVQWIEESSRDSVSAMYTRKTAIAAVLLAVAVAEWVAEAAVHKVGDSAGWTTIGNVDYKLWAASKTFNLGDVVSKLPPLDAPDLGFLLPFLHLLYFEFEYYSQFHNVMRVTHSMYKSCNGSKPLATYTTGNDSITITTRGHHYFMCGVPGHCQAGQKVDINVPRLLSPGPAPSALSSPSSPFLNPPNSSPSNAASCNHFNPHFWALVLLVFTNFAAFLSGF